MSSAAMEKKAQGNEFIKQKDYDNAIKLYTEAIELDSNEHTFYSNRSMAYFGKGDYAKAAADGRECVAKNPKFLKGYHRAANAMKELEQYKEAVALLEKGRLHFPNNADLKMLYNSVKSLYDKQEEERRAALKGPAKLKEEGNDLFKAAKFEDAIEKYTQALNSCEDPESEVALAIRNNRAACNQQLSNFHGVVDDTTMVIEHQPQNLKALIRRGLALEALEKYRSALNDIRQALTIDPSAKIANQAQHRLGRAVRELKAAKKAI